MARFKVVLSIILFILIALARQDDIFAYQVYTDGNISNTYVTYFNDILNNYVGIEVDYVIWRNGQYEYCLAVGDLDFNNRTYSGSSIDVYSISTNVGSSATRINRSTVGTFTLNNSNNILVYSNLGYMPNSYERSETYAFTLLIIISLYFIYRLVWFILRHGLR